ncbi:MAG TPA: hypothetical protein VKY54_13510, partial [Kiloniellales bacterium]|nr:hypothetical protein [Kiloniellales bacterium]
AFDVSWRGTINSSDFITIVPAGSEEGKVEGHIRVRDHSEGRLTAPGTPGLYELRYVLEEGRRTLASEIVEVAEAEVVLAGPSTVRAGAAVDVTWSNTINASDFITIVPAGSDEGTVNSHIRARDNSEGRLTAPDAPGLYEVRYVLEAGRRTLAASPFEVVAADAPLDEGAGLSVPATAAPGETITVSWTIEADDADRRITLAPADSPPFTWISAHRVGAEQETEITLPDAQGQYEVRFLDITSQSVLGRAIVAVGQ